MIEPHDISEAIPLRKQGLSLIDISRRIGFAPMEIESYLEHGGKRPSGFRGWVKDDAWRSENPVATRIRELREARGRSQGWLAQEMGYDHSAVSLYESGKRKPGRDALIDIAAALDLGPRERDELLMLAGFMPVDRESLIDDDPAVRQLRALLADEELDAARREAIVAGLNAFMTLAWWPK